MKAQTGERSPHKLCHKAHRGAAEALRLQRDSDGEAKLTTMRSMGEMRRWLEAEKPAHERPAEKAARLDTQSEEQCAAREEAVQQLQMQHERFRTDVCRLQEMERRYSHQLDRLQRGR